MECVIQACNENPSYNRKIPKFSLPKNKDLQKKWLNNIGSHEVAEKLKSGGGVCLIHFEDHYIENHNRIHPSAIPTLKLNKGNTFVDYEELLLSSKSPVKKKRGTSGLKNLQIARRKKMMRRERMQRLALQRRLAKLENQAHEVIEKPKIPAYKPALPTIYDINRDYFLGENNETSNEKIIISLRLTSLMKHLYDGRTTFTKHASIRDTKTYPLFAKVCKIRDLLSPENPVFWSINQVQTFFEKVVDQKGLTKRIEMHEIDGESLLNLSQSDFKNYFDLDSNVASTLSDACEQLKKETIMRFVNS